jgi:hypothetical protein
MIKSTIRALGAAGALLAAATFVAVPVQAPQAQDASPGAQKQRMIDLGIEQATARNLYEHFKREAGGGQPLTWRNVPDWTGIWTREAGPFFWDPDQASPAALPTAKLTPEHQKLLMEKLDQVSRGIEYDPLSECEPAGMPRWIVEPFLKEFVVTPEQTYLINEMQNEIRRIYTDGRDHPPDADAYPLWEGDSIAFWDNGKLVIHTSQMRAGQYQRIQPYYTEQVEVVEVWEKTADDTMVAHVWAYDPPALLEPWYTKQVFKRLSNDDNSLRIRHWHCGENPNNAVEKTDEGTSDFSNFTFTDKDDR